MRISASAACLKLDAYDAGTADLASSSGGCLSRRATKIGTHVVHLPSIFSVCLDRRGEERSQGGVVFPIVMVFDGRLVVALSLGVGS